MENTIQIINKEYPTIKEIFSDVEEEAIKNFIKNNGNGNFTIKVLK
jgi:hypothetical protein